MSASSRREFLGGLAGGTAAAVLAPGAAAGAPLSLTDRVARAIVLLAREAAQRQSEDGRLANFGEPDNVTDMAANGEPVLRAAEHLGDPGLRAASDCMLEYLLKRAPRCTDGTIHHVSNKPEVWIDSMYMAPPFLAVAGEPAEAVRQVEGLRLRLWDGEKRLFSHIWDETAASPTSGRTASSTTSSTTRPRSWRRTSPRCWRIRSTAGPGRGGSSRAIAP